MTNSSSNSNGAQAVEQQLRDWLDVDQPLLWQVRSLDMIFCSSSVQPLHCAVLTSGATSSSSSSSSFVAL
jgi:hypothetical protein